MTTRESKYSSLKTLTGQSSGYTPAELEKIWLRLETGEASSVDQGFLEDLYLTQQGYTTGTLGERWFALLGALGYTGTLGERYQQFWAAGGLDLQSFLTLEDASGFLLLENGDYLLLET